jgi:hypothetical protein
LSGVRGAAEVIDPDESVSVDFGVH